MNIFFILLMLYTYSMQGVPKVLSIVNESAYHVEFSDASKKITPIQSVVENFELHSLATKRVEGGFMIPAIKTLETVFGLIQRSDGLHVYNIWQEGITVLPNDASEWTIIIAKNGFLKFKTT